MAGMKRGIKQQEGKGPLDLIEEAFHLLRRAPASTLATYYVGSLPFILMALFFWSDMSRSAFAEQRLPAEALLLALLFFWMKTWQALFAREMLSQLSGDPGPQWTLRRWARVAIIQAILQPSGLFLLPVSLVVLAPFGWMYAFYQNVTSLGAGQAENVGQVFKSAWRQALLWPLQNHYVLFLLQPFALFVFLNLIGAALTVPYLLNKFFGVETAFSQSFAATINSTFFAAILGLTYLCVDPILKAIYLLRCFYGESLQTGRDLKAELKSVQLLQSKAGMAGLMLAVALMLAGCLQPSSLFAAEPAPARREAITPAELDRSIEEVLQHREFSWRMPREKVQEKADAKKGAFATFLQKILKSLQEGIKTVGRWLETFVKWLVKYMRFRPSGSINSEGLISTMHALLVVAIVGLVVGLGFLLFKLWRNHQPAPPELDAEAVSSVPDLADENVGADQLPEDGWLNLARELTDKGEFRLALRALYLASLAHLAAGNLITIARFKSNRDYERELQRRGHAFPDLLNLFARNVSIFDRVWYGLHEVTAELVADFARNVEEGRNRLRASPRTS